MEERLHHANGTLLEFQSDVQLSGFVSALVEQANDMGKKYIKLYKTLLKKIEQLKDILFSTKRYQEDHSELSKWLTNKEQALAEIKEHCQHASEKHFPRIVDRLKVYFFNYSFQRLPISFTH